MGIFDRLFHRETRAITEDRYSWLVLPTAAGVSVNADTALKSPTCLACVRVISEAVAQLPVHVYQRLEGSEKQRAPDHPAWRLLHDRPNPWTSSFEFRRQLMVDAMLHGAGYAAVIRTRGQIRELHRLPPAAVTVELDENTGEPSYRFRQSTGGDVSYGWADIIHIPGVPKIDGKSDAITHLIREAIAVDIAMAEHQARLFGNGARPAGILKVPGRLNEDAISRIRESWNNQHGGGANSGKTAVLESGVEFQPIALSSTDAQFLELRRFAVADIARGFRVPLIFAGDLERATWRNVEQLGQHFLTFALMPWLKVWEAALTRAVLADDEQESHFVEFLIDDLVRADIAARFEAFNKAVGGPWMTANEVRAADNRAPIEGGDVLRTPLNTAPAGQNQPDGSGDDDDNGDADDA